jgi:hypothetical protein
MKVLMFILTCFITMSSLAQSNLSVYLVGIKSNTQVYGGSITAVHYDPLQEDIYQVYYQIKSNTMNESMLRQLNVMLKDRYLYDLDFGFYNVDYSDVYMPFLGLPRHNHIDYKTTKIDNEATSYSHKIQLMQEEFSNYRNFVFGKCNLDSIATTWNDTFYKSEVLEMNTWSAVFPHFRINDAFNYDYRHSHHCWDYKQGFNPIDNHYVRIVMDSFLHISTTEEIVINIKSLKNVALYDELVEVRKKDYLYGLMKHVYDSPEEVSDHGETSGYYELDYYPSLIHNNESEDHGLRFSYISDCSSHKSPFLYNGGSFSLSFEFVEPFLKEKSVYREIFKFHNN